MIIFFFNFLNLNVLVYEVMRTKNRRNSSEALWYVSCAIVRVYVRKLRVDSTAFNILAKPRKEGISWVIRGEEVRDGSVRVELEIAEVIEKYVLNFNWGDDCLEEVNAIGVSEFLKVILCVFFYFELLVKLVERILIDLLRGSCAVQRNALMKTLEELFFL